MKSIIMAGLLATTFTLTQNANAAPHGDNMRAHVPRMEMIKMLSHLSLSSEQMDEVKNLIVAFKANHERPTPRPEKPDFATLSQSEIRSLVEGTMLNQQSHRFAIAQLRSDVYNLLSASQRNVLTELEAERAAKHGWGNTKRDANRNTDSSAMRGQPPRGPRRPFKELQLTEDQLVSLKTLNNPFRETRLHHSATMEALRNAEQTLVQSENFSESAWNALYAEYKEDLIHAAIENITHKQASFAVLTDAQQAELQQKREDLDTLRRLFSDN